MDDRLGKVLIVDDDLDLIDMLSNYFLLKGYEIYTAYDGKEALDKMKYTPDLVILDVNMPKLNGIDVCKRIRDFTQSPILFLTARATEEDKVNGLLVGGDDYIVKPFESMELLARIEVVLRRTGKFSDIFEYRNIKVDFAKREVFKNNEKIEMTAQEFELLKVLIQNKNLALSREKLLESAWGYDYYGDTRTVDMHIQRLRKKLSWDDIIVTVYKYGYRLEI